MGPAPWFRTKCGVPLLLWEEGWPTKSGDDESLRRAVLIAFLYCFYLQISKQSKPGSLGMCQG